ncbi:protein of unknown function DUF177 [Thalassoporum mexicanum PCC 7367]|uniref:YceD family protein n=1 Tax=Thalassoporum mexicanum TaxID=3457544 RepID=UPI00029F9593|nr:YceD family protein [Pseudanabaena sp. PCC 7367]AFY71672.1 protein of unknown function DUF177 [Pseudanabaena sp. PCC 7367]
MERIYIPQLLKAIDATETIEFRQFIDGLDSLTPVSGVIEVCHMGNFLAVSATANTIVTLTCDRTLKQFNHRLAIDTSEDIWLFEPLPESDFPKEREITFDDLADTLSPQGYFDPQNWLYEQLVLAIPVQKFAPDAPDLIQTAESLEDDAPVIDKRWAALQALNLSE